ncbi:hypothetical protein AAG570_009605 [Ranatra chinensis]|uniref:Uncharacterized protein n=1 Tax=Ranatra chinensis TaxID=642074 RepID=A0ABD0YPJ5_9HEMI
MSEKFGHVISSEVSMLVNKSVASRSCSTSTALVNWAETAIAMKFLSSVVGFIAFVSFFAHLPDSSDAFFSMRLPQWYHLQSANNPRQNVYENRTRVRVEGNDVYFNNNVHNNNDNHAHNNNDHNNGAYNNNNGTNHHSFHNGINRSFHNNDNSPGLNNTVSEERSAVLAV